MVFPSLKISFEIKTESGVLPVPPIYIFPTHITGILNSTGVTKRFLYLPIVLIIMLM